MAAIKKEMNNWKWTLFTIGYMTVFAYSISLIVYQFGLLFTGNANIIGIIFASLVLIIGLYFLFRPNKYLKHEYKEV